MGQGISLSFFKVHSRSWVNVCIAAYFARSHPVSQAFSPTGVVALPLQSGEMRESNLYWSVFFKDRNSRGSFKVE